MGVRVDGCVGVRVGMSVGVRVGMSVGGGGGVRSCNSRSRVSLTSPTPVEKAFATGCTFAAVARLRAR